MSQLPFLIAFNLLISCKPKPQAHFSSSNTFENPRINERIEFYNESEDANSYEWDFGDGNTSTLKDPVHTYIEPGVYNISLLAYSLNKRKRNLFIRTYTVRPPIPSKVFMTHIKVSEFPASRSNGESWNAGDGPNLTLGIFRGSYRPNYFFLYEMSDSYFEKAQNDMDYIFEFNPPLEINFSNEYYVSLLHKEDPPVGYGELMAESRLSSMNLVDSPDSLFYSTPGLKLKFYAYYNFEY